MVDEQALGNASGKRYQFYTAKGKSVGKIDTSTLLKPISTKPEGQEDESCRSIRPK
jgi:hypothetical protein